MLSSREKRNTNCFGRILMPPFCRTSLCLKMDNSLWPIIDVVGPAETGMKFQKQEHLRSPPTLSHPWCDCRPPHPHPSPSPPHSPHPSCSSPPHHLRIFHDLSISVQRSSRTGLLQMSTCEGVCVAFRVPRVGPGWSSRQRTALLMEISSDRPEILQWLKLSNNDHLVWLVF